MLSVASAINLSAQTTYKARVINQDTGEPIIGAVIKGNKGIEAVARSQKALGSKVDHVDIENLSKNAHTNSLSDMLDGKIGGVQMYQSNGKVGMPIRFNMRSGATMSMERDPIIYVDGVKYNSSHISDINSSQDALSALNDLTIDDIATIDVIKGPSAAASYGAEAANGVIVITTKRGKNNNPENRKADIQVKMCFLHTW